MASLRYDFHRFTTDELQARGFSQSQGVQRVSATVGLARGRPMSSAGSTAALAGHRVAAALLRRHCRPQPGQRL